MNDMTTYKTVMLQKLAWLPNLTAILALISCKGVVLMVAMFPLIGFTVTINPHLQAVVISLFALLTLVFVFVNYKKIRKIFGPLIMAVVGFSLIVGTIYVAYDELFETIGLLVLTVSAIWTWRCSKTEIASVSYRLR